MRDHPPYTHLLWKDPSRAFSLHYRIGDPRPYEVHGPHMQPDRFCDYEEALRHARALSHCDEPEPVWRVGRKVGRTLYRHGQLVGMVDTREMAATICEAMNRAENEHG